MKRLLIIFPLIVHDTKHGETEASERQATEANRRRDIGGERGVQFASGCFDNSTHATLMQIKHVKIELNREREVRV